jgi:hypothetical protein
VIDAARAKALAMPGCRLLETNGTDALADTVYGQTIISEGTST